MQIPVAVKMPPYFSSIGHIATRFVDAGANGLVIFNRYLQPDINLARLSLASELELSSPNESYIRANYLHLLKTFARAHPHPVVNEHLRVQPRYR